MDMTIAELCARLKTAPDILTLPATMYVLSTKIIEGPCLYGENLKVPLAVSDRYQPEVRMHAAAAAPVAPSKPVAAMTVDELQLLIQELKSGPRSSWPWEMIQYVTNVMAEKIRKDVR